ncbi:MAG: preprotein translocase subunit SecA [Alphaproteobacteria bacterium]|nr:preprotein translocase subunit SecA [Alphaproteobacteria bacterium]
MKLISKLFGSQNERRIKSLQKIVEKINGLEAEIEKLSDTKLKSKTKEFQKRIKNGESLDSILPEAFAVVREAGKRVLNMRAFDVQLIGGLTLHNGDIAEMKTGEGKTLVATLPVYLNALSGKGVHVVTVNDYLAQRDANWMGQVYEFLGLTVGKIYHGLNDTERKEAYACDITYGTNNEFGFDYLRDNMKLREEDRVQRDFNFAIIDEVDSILIDEARTPLIISGPTEDFSEEYKKVNKIIPLLEDDDFEKDEKQKTVVLTEQGNDHVEELLIKNKMLKGESLYDMQNVNLVHHINQALKAHKLFEKDKDYIVKDDQVIIIDEFTGRMMPGRRYSEGLHQSLEAKEDVKIQQENQTLASVTFQNFFRMYPKLSGMTGTALTEEAEFSEIYDLNVLAIPTNLPIARIDQDDEIYRTRKEKYKAIVDQILQCHDRNQPVLVGTTSIENSEDLSKLLKKHKIKHNILNAKFHEQEAYIIAQAGVPGAITIATNMAGRGTDIKLGGNLEMRLEKELNGITDEKKIKKITEKIEAEIEKAKEVAMEAGGLYVLATERHESRRIDNQLRGRTGRQGDAGESKFFLSIEDDLMRIFGSERMDAVLKTLGLKDGEALVHPWINKAIEKAQKKVEAQNFEIRKNLLKYDDVMNDQRKVIYDQRKEIMAANDLSETIKDFRHEVIEDIVYNHVPKGSYKEQWDVEGMDIACKKFLNIEFPFSDWIKEEGLGETELLERIINLSNKYMAEKVSKYGPKVIRSVEKGILLQVMDHLWKEHLLSLDHLRTGISLRAYGQKDPLNEYKREAFNRFEMMLASLKEGVTSILTHVEFQTNEKAIGALRPEQEMHETRVDPALEKTENEEVKTIKNAKFNKSKPETWSKLPRNSLCPCGSGKKYKHCHGKVN